MKLLVISHKEMWRRGDGYVTVGGFSRQMTALATLFDSTIVLATERRSAAPAGCQPIEGRDLRVVALPEPRGQGLLRKLGLLLWVPRQLPVLLAAIRRADAVHALVPGDVGVIGLMLALLLGKPLLVRHCGTWGSTATMADRFLAVLLPRIATGARVVLATGEDVSPPSPGRPGVTWIFATTLDAAELESVGEPRESPPPGGVLRLISVGRLSEGKNTATAILAAGLIRRQRLVSLDVVGDGPCRSQLERLVADLDLGDAVRFHGNVDHAGVLQLLRGAHVFVFPTRVAEGFPKAAIEALACAVPVVAPPVSALRSLLSEGGGILLESVEPEDVAAACLALAEPSRFQQASRAALDRASGYTLEAWAVRIEERLLQAWGGRPLRNGGGAL